MAAKPGWLSLGAAHHVGVDPGEVGHADVDAEVADLQAQDVEQLLEARPLTRRRRRSPAAPRCAASEATPEHVAAARDDVGQARVDHAPVADEVDVELRGEDVGIEVAQRPGGGDARVGDADVDAAAFGHDLVDRRWPIDSGSVMSQPAHIASPRPAAARSAPSASRSSSATRWVAESRRAVSRPMPRAAPVTTATGRVIVRRLLRARHAVVARVLLVVGALAERLRDGEGDQALHEHGEDDEEDDHQARRWRPMH